MQHQLVLASVFLLGAGTATAGAAGPLEACQQASESRQVIKDCLERRLQAADAAMEKVAMSVHSRMAELDRVAGRPAIVAKFEDSERAFREYLDRHCAWAGASVSGGGSADTTNDCLIRLTEQHTAELQLQLTDGRPAVPAASFAPISKTHRAGTIPGGEWRLVYLEDEGHRHALPDEPWATLAFDKNGTAAGRSFVNRYFGTATLTELGQFNWNGALGSTKMAGPPELMEAEDQYLRALGRVSHWRVEGTTLTLDSGDGEVLLRYSR